MTGRLLDHVAIVTGAGRGLGRAIARQLAQEGARVVVNDQGVDMDGSKPAHDSADQVVSEIVARGGKAVASYDDVSDFWAAKRLVQSALDTFGKLDILVNSAGIVRERWLHEMDEDDWDRVVAVHLKGTFNSMRHASAAMRERRYGRIVNIASPVGVLIGGSTRIANYAAAKGGVYGLTIVAVNELGPFGITANVVLPRGADSRVLRHSLETAKAADAAKPRSKGARPAVWQTIRVNPPESISPLVAYLCTAEAKFINGQIFFAYGNTYTWCRPVTAERQIDKQEEQWTVDELIEAMPQTLLEGVGKLDSQTQ